ncbi:DUF853 domain-containing protein, partial [Neisseria sicca]|uniref:DUF853 domain-containing protein n=1 Tax=Neisseria sicca TaxID=490 RepID=UPI0021C07DA7
MLGELFERVGEVGDLEKGKLVMFLEEGDLMLEKGGNGVVEEVEEVVGVMGWKGVGVYLVRENGVD